MSEIEDLIAKGQEELNEGKYKAEVSRSVGEAIRKIHENPSHD